MLNKVERYLYQDYTKEDLNQQFQKDIASLFLDLVQIVRDILACPLISVGIKRFFSPVRRVTRQDYTKIILESIKIIIFIKLYDYTIKATRKSGRIKYNKAERLSKPQDIFSRIIEEDEISKDKVDKF